MARSIQLANELILLEGSSSIMHVSKMILALYIILVISHELVLVRKLKENSEELQQLDDYLIVAFLSHASPLALVRTLSFSDTVLKAYPSESLNLLDVLLENRGLLAFMKPIELWNVIHLDVILDTIAEASSETA